MSSADVWSKQYRVKSPYVLLGIQIGEEGLLPCTDRRQIVEVSNERG